MDVKGVRDRVSPLMECVQSMLGTNPRLPIPVSFSLMAYRLGEEYEPLLGDASITVREDRIVDQADLRARSSYSGESYRLRTLSNQPKPPVLGGDI